MANGDVPTGVSKTGSTISRRGVLKAAGAAAGVAAGAGGTAALLGRRSEQDGAPAVVTNTQAGRKFRAYVKYSTEIPMVVELKARPLQARQVAIRVEAAQTCYTNVDDCLV